MPLLCHSRGGGNPVPGFFVWKGEVDRRFRGDDSQRDDSQMDGRQGMAFFE